MGFADEFYKRNLAEVRRKLAELRNTDDEEVNSIIIETVFNDAQAANMSLSEADETVTRIFCTVRRRLGILDPLMHDDSVTEIMVNGPDNIFIERNGTMCRYGLHFASREELEEILRNIAADVHREINEMNPIVDARLADGSRVNGVFRNIAVNGPILTVRKFSGNAVTMEDLEANGTLTQEQSVLLKILTEARYNIFISGGTSSGKTTLLNALAGVIPKDERVIVIEDSMELKMSDIENIVHLECRGSNSQGRGTVTMRQLVRSSLRMRPDRIIVGEVRGDEVIELTSAMNTGHSGSLSTGHGNSAAGMLKRLEAMYMMALPLDTDAIRAQIAEGIDIIVHLEKTGAGKRRISEIVELEDCRDGEYVLNRIFSPSKDGYAERTGNRLRDTARIYLKGEKYADILRQNGFID